MILLALSACHLVGPEPSAPDIAEPPDTAAFSATEDPDAATELSSAELRDTSAFAPRTPPRRHSGR